MPLKLAPKQYAEPELYPLQNLGEVGVIKDLPPADVPDNAWSDVQNVRMDQGEIQSFSGHEAVATPTVQPYGIFPVTRDIAHYWVYMGLAAAYSFDGTTHVNVSPTVAFTGGATDLWVGTVLNENLVVTNGFDEPHYWDMNVANNFVKLPGWPAAGRAQAITAYKQFLVALNVEISGTAYPYRVMWSHQAPGSGIPTSWDETDATLDAGFQNFGDKSARLMNAGQVSDVLALFAENQLHTMTYIGGSRVFRFTNVSLEAGLVARRALCSFSQQDDRPAALVFMSDGDILLTDARALQSIIDKRMREWFFASVDQDNVGLCVMTHNRQENEVWLAFPEQGASFLTHVLVWNYKTSARPWTVRELPASLMDIQRGLVLDTGPLLWSDMVKDWSEYPDLRWGARTYNSSDDVLLSASAGSIYRFDTGRDFGASPPTCFAERTGLKLAPGQTTVVGVRPRASGQAFNIQVGSQPHPEGPITWGTARTFTPGVDRRVDARSTGHFITIRVSSSDGSAWRLKDLLLEWEPAGGR
jgi:hypothetical protein